MTNTNLFFRSAFWEIHIWVFMWILNFYTHQTKIHSSYTAFYLKKKKKIIVNKFCFCFKKRSFRRFLIGLLESTALQFSILILISKLTRWIHISTILFFTRKRLRTNFNRSVYVCESPYMYDNICIQKLWLDA